uniref:Retrovirus-related Pol polyprotein from transposon TNT 1-94 n=1 Tax=Cajanus cajan TaxID=3821 RepID=A0A151R8R8_CAJCA|nr:Retrovirus-related Pol polyprotein from transposon TNT 1-94 [Cajanus cajan]
MNLRYRESSSISDHLNEFQGLLDQLSKMGIKFDDEVLRLQLLNTLPESWESFQVSITNSAPNGVVSLQTAKSGALNEEMRRKAHDSLSQSEVLITKNRGKSQKKRIEGWKEFFTSYTSNDFGVLKMGNDGVSKVIGVGDVCLQTNMGM